MAVTVQRTITVAASPREAMELVLDLDAYRRIDPKLREVVWAPHLNAEGRGVAKVVSSMWWFPPVADTHVVHLERWRSVSFTGQGRLPARALYSFARRVDADAVADGTRLTHRYEIALRGPLVRAEARLRRRLEGDLVDEMARLAHELGAGGARRSHLAPVPEYGP